MMKHLFFKSCLGLKLLACYGILALVCFSACKRPADAQTCGAQSADVRVNVMSFNIRLDIASDGENSWAYRKDHVAQMLHYYSPDILGMQEVVKNQRDDMLHASTVFAAVGVGREDGKELGEFNSLFYNKHRFESLQEGTFGLSENPDSIGLMGWDSACPRIATWALLKDKVSGKQLAAVNTHLDHIGVVARREGARLIVSKLKELFGDVPVVLTGDFNCTSDSEPVALLQDNGMRNCALEAAVKYGPAWSFHNFGRIPVEKRTLIDYIFVTGDVAVNSYRVIGDKPDTGYLSDHAPIFVNLTLK